MELEIGKGSIFRASAHQLHISGNFTSVHDKGRGFRIGLELADQRYLAQTSTFRDNPEQILG